MVHIFYLLGFIFLINEISKTFKPLKALRDRDKYIDKMKNLNGESSKKLAMELLGKVFYLVSYMVWTLIGLLSSQWYLFLSMFLVGFITVGFNKLSTNLKYRAGVLSFDAAVSTSLLGYVIMNHFHHFNII